MPQFWVIAGPNGAGKTTIADRWLATRIPVISPDSIAVNHKVGAVQAAKLAIKEQEQLLSDASSFAIDTTFSGVRELALMKRAAESGYKVNLIFVCVASPSLCHARIIERVESGGHAVPPDDVVRRYHRSISNLFKAFDIPGRIFVFDNTGERRRLILSVENGSVKHLSKNLPDWTYQAIPSRFTKSRDYGI